MAERDALFECLAYLRSLLPARAEEMAGARREAARIRQGNRRLADKVRRLQQQRISPGDRY